VADDVLQFWENLPDMPNIDLTRASLQDGWVKTRNMLVGFVRRELKLAASRDL
jgi:hypothetical protein